MSELHFQSIKGKAHEILRAILQTPEVSSCSRKDVIPLRLACEEIVMNITTYAYLQGEGDSDESHAYLDVEIEKSDDLIVIRFIDGGIPFNPLEQPMPDTTLSWNHRNIGGLGIFLIIEKMDAVHYAYEDNENVLTIERIIRENGK